ncbi:MAG: isoprenylcysteine carboxylmethyltransferase family protein, partial [Candidatus Micrarchaeota archaeon]
VFLIGFLIPGFDYRFGWSNMLPELVFVADVIVIIGYILIFLVFKENHYAARTVEVEKGQKVITSGLYSIVRHPMYVGVILMFLATPIALGSYFALPIFLLMIPLLVYRIFNEEKILLRDLAGYKKFCQKTRYRLIPFIW